MEELIRGSLIEDGYYESVISRDALELLKDVNIEGSTKLDFTRRHLLKSVTRFDDQENISYLQYSSPAARFLVSTLLAFGQHKLWRKPVKVEDFKKYTSRALEEYCSTKEFDEYSARKIKRLSLSETQIQHLINRSGRYFRDMCEMQDNKIKLRCSLRDVILPKV